MALNLKKLVCAAVAALCVGVVGAGAEIHSNAIGLRLAGGSLLGGELNYQKEMGGDNRLEIGASGSFKSDNIYGAKYNTIYLGAIGIYQWHFGITGVNGFNWYVGPGAGVGFGSYSYSYELLGTKYSHDDSWLYLDVGGQIGIEYDLNVNNVPLLLSLDVRPMFGVLHDGGFGWGAGLGIRYTF
ncbi:MAG: hypothetical protein LBC59_02025 [Chitinispirillales bacterium]|jgi:hypothetical protein|nr:hypothetical protein [Chitinispirillales bacterium]